MKASPLGASLEFLEDPEGRLDLDGARSASGWEKAKSDMPGFGFTDSVYWARFALRNPYGDEREFLLQQTYVLLDDIRLYAPNADGEYSLTRTGDLIPFKDRPVKHRTFVFRLKLDPGQTAVYYIRQSTTSGMNFQYSIWDSRTFTELDQEELSILWLLYGVIMGVAAYNLLAFLGTFDRPYLYYVGFVGNHALVLLCLNGLAVQFLWPDMVVWSNLSIAVVLYLDVIFGILFTKLFLHSRENTPLIHHIYTGVSAVAGLGILLTFVSGMGGDINPVLFRACILGGVLLALLAIVSLPIYSVYLMFKGVREAYFFFVSWMFLTVGGTLYLLRSLGVLADFELAKWGVLFGTVAQAVILASGLADRINVYRKRESGSQHAQSHGTARKFEA